MNKAIYTFLLAFTIAIAGHAQTVIWSENFEYHYQSSFSAPWTVQTNIGGAPWGCDIDYHIGGLCFPVTDNNTRVAGIRSQYACYPHHSDSSAILMTPVINLTGYSTAGFRYDSYFTHHTTGGIYESATVEVSTDSGYTWTVLRNAPTSVGIHYETQYVNLNAYAGSRIRLGFRYSDNSTDSMTGWMIDNLVAFVPTQHDIQMIGAGPTDPLLGYALQGDSILVNGRVINMGGQNITAYSIGYRMDNGAIYNDSITGLNLASFDTATFQLSRPAVMTTSDKHIESLWAHTAGDVNPINDSAKAIFYGAAFIPNKQTVLEAGVGTWNSFGAQQYVMMDAIKSSDYPVSVIEMHDDDPMQSDMGYRDYILHLKGNSVPFFLFDRVDNIVPNRYLVINGLIYSLFTQSDLFNQLQIDHNHFGFASLSLQPDMSAGNTLQVNVTVKPAINLSGNYRLALMLTEDSVHGSGSGWEQINLFSGGLYGVMGGYESLPNPVPATSMVYNNVSRSATPSADGTGAVLPANMVANNQYSKTLDAPLNAGWTVRHLKAIVLLLNGSDKTILNAASVPIFPLDIPTVNSSGLIAAVYPNPASTSADLLIQSPEEGAMNISITDVMGKVIEVSEKHLQAGRQIIPIRTNTWTPGMYLITIRMLDKEKVLKLTVLP